MWLLINSTEGCCGSMLAKVECSCGLLTQIPWYADFFSVGVSANIVQKIQFESIARNEYTKNDLKNPVDCSLFYIALRKKTVLQGLWRMASWNREQAATVRLLANNFQDKKWKTAALKNAYALLGKRRHGTCW